MGAGKININPGCSRQTENLEFPAFEYDTRLRRRWKRRCIANEMMKHNHRAHAHATRKNKGSCGNAFVNTTENSGHMEKEEVDEDYQFFLDNFLFQVDVLSANNVGCSDVDDNRSRRYDDCDAQYKRFLENLREDGNSYIFEVFADNQLFHVKYEGQEEERLHDLVNNEVQCHSADEDYQLYLNSSRIEGDSLMYMPERAVVTKYQGSESEEKSSRVRQNFQVPNVAIEPPNTRRSLDNYHVAKHKCNSDVLRDMVDEDYQLYLNSSRIEGDSLVYMPERAMATKYQQSESEEKSSTVGQNLQVPNVATEPPNTRQSSDNYHVAKHNCNSEVLRDMVDEDYQLFLNSLNRVGVYFVNMQENGVTVEYEEDNDRSSADSEVIILEPNQYGNSPFICSKSYDSSWFADERNSRDSFPLSAYDPSPYRIGLMENLERPYDQNEYDKLLHEASCRRTKERHRETRNGVIKSCPLGGVNKSNLELHSDLAKAIDEVKEPHRVLFLLRGFFYWMEHVTQEGVFRPWLDESCLEILQKM